MITPLDNESQTEFAIRFHDSMVEEIPNTDERNQACFDTWRDHGGDEREPAVGIGLEQYSREDFDVVRDVVVFTEHDTEDRVDKTTGNTVPGEHYDRDALVDMIDGMNERIVDCSQFSPLSKGHTDPEGDSDPETMGFAGGYRLGMIGNKEPRYGIFTDEYRRKDAAPEFDRRRGRSPEVWKYSRMRNRFFYPIAILGSNAPRLDMPPARYSRDQIDRYSRKDIDQQDVEVEHYMVVGGNTGYSPNTFGGRDHYGDDFGGDGGGMGGDMGGMTDDVIHRIVAALFNTAPLQWVMQQMQSGANDAARPAVQNPVGMDSGGMPPMDGGGMPPMDGGGMPPAGGMGGGMPQQPPMGGGMPPQPGGQQFPQRYERDKPMDKASQARIEKLEKELESERTHRIQVERHSRLSSLKESYDLDVDAELERTAPFNAEQFDSHCTVITERYRRNPESIPDYSSLPAPAAPGKASSELTEDDVAEVEKYALTEGLTYGQARDRYIREQKNSASA